MCTVSSAISGLFLLFLHCQQVNDFESKKSGGGEGKTPACSKGSFKDIQSNFENQIIHHYRLKEKYQSPAQ